MSSLTEEERRGAAEEVGKLADHVLAQALIAMHDGTSSARNDVLMLYAAVLVVVRELRKFVVANESPMVVAELERLAELATMSLPEQIK